VRCHPNAARRGEGARVRAFSRLSTASRADNGELFSQLSNSVEPRITRRSSAHPDPTCSRGADRRPSPRTRTAIGAIDPSAIRADRSPRPSRRIREFHRLFSNANAHHATIYRLSPVDPDRRGHRPRYCELLRAVSISRSNEILRGSNDFFISRRCIPPL